VSSSGGRQFSTWTGKAGLYLEDLFVAESQRGKGIGKALFAWLGKAAKVKCVFRGAGRLTLAGTRLRPHPVAGPGLECPFHRLLQEPGASRRDSSSPDAATQGAEMPAEWLNCRLTGDAMERLADLA
jgi:GNAT superfamily N-acetyltransferase